ncbi:conserved unknown protein [Ectocarpus siliculosus]|uniref:Uncharacterized protein n=1 Tax=Ectocarpus siliculosus TaxID=2880 RepID=D8LRI6_ECTSI|nr:conserved unknown protein [Ectocarpus siliculosus]|eukprot:CBN75087.1 conserved unknown protein [Ectocarpus siliculosus]
MTATGNREVHNLLSIMVVLLPATWSLLMPPTCFPSRFWVPRHAQVAPKMRCQGECGTTRAATAAANASRQASWGVGVSSWVAGATSFSRSAIHASTPEGVGAWWNGSSSAGGGAGGGGGNNGTDGGASAGGAMGEGDDAKGASDMNACSTQHRDRGERASSTVDMSGGEPKKSASFGPWVWLSAMWGMYAAWLRRSPLVAKAVTSGVLGLSGDMAAQFFEFQQKAESGRRGPFLKNNRRLTAVAIDSILITGPALHALYGLLECLIPTVGGGFVPAALHVVIDTFVFDPMFVASFFCVTGMLESRPLRKSILPALRREFWPAVQGSWLVSLLFCPLQFATFRYLPLEFRVLSVNACDIAWTSVMSYFSHKAVPAEGVLD